MSTIDDIIISVIIPVYNAEQTLNRCIQSLVEQTHHKIEIIFIDDGSTDSSIEIIQHLSQTDSRTRLILKQNEGPGSARNRGLEQMTGDYFCFIDCDDYVDKNYLSLLLSYALKYDANIVQTDYISIDTNEKVQQASSNKQELLISPASCLLEFSKQEKIYNFPWGKLFKSDTFRKIRFPQLYKAEDKVYLYKILMKCNRCFITNERTYYYVLTTNSLSRACLSMKDFDEIKAGIEILNLCKSTQIHLIPYWSAYIASRAALLYCKLSCSDINDKKKLMDYTLAVFNLYYHNKNNSFIIAKKKRALFIYSFRFNKQITVWLYKILFNRTKRKSI